MFHWFAPESSLLDCQYLTAFESACQPQGEPGVIRSHPVTGHDHGVVRLYIYQVCVYVSSALYIKLGPACNFFLYIISRQHRRPGG